MGQLRTKTLGRKKPVTGFSLAELMTVVVIGGILTAAGIIYMSGYLPRQKLNSETQRLRNFLVTAMERAKNEQDIFCLKINRTSSPVSFEVYRDVNANLNCPEAGDTLVDSISLDSNITIPACSSTSYTNWATPWFLFFYGNGKMEVRNITTQATTAYNFEIVLSSSRLSSGQRAREIEIATAQGRVEISPMNKPGIYRTVVGPTPSPAPTNPLGPRYCE